EYYLPWQTLVSKSDPEDVTLPRYGECEVSMMRDPSVSSRILTTGTIHCSKLGRGDYRPSSEAASYITTEIFERIRRSVKITVFPPVK
ncbi:hypothetical protein MPH_04976, partial [Macrophomina phaseolina MS6]